VRQLVLPDSNDLPALRPEPPKIALVAATIRPKFVSPELRELVFPTWESPAVPEITIDEDGNALAAEYHIGTAWERANVTLELYAMPTQLTLNGSLKRAVPQSDGLHSP
jgi:hypothetical protein